MSRASEPTARASAFAATGHSMGPAMHALRRAASCAWNNLERWLIVVSYSYFCVIILTEVVRRYWFGASSVWGEMTARYAFVLLVYVAMAEVAKRRDHIRIDLVPRRLGDRGRLLLYLYIDLLHLLLVGLVVFYSIRVMQLQIGNDIQMPAADWNMAIAHAVLPFGWGLLGLRVIARSVTMVREYRRTGKVAAGGGGFGE